MVERAGGRGICSHYTTKRCELRRKAGLFPYVEHSQGPRKLTAQPLSLCEGHPSRFLRLSGRAGWPPDHLRPPCRDGSKAPGQLRTLRSPQGRGRMRRPRPGQLHAPPSAPPQAGITRPACTKDLASSLMPSVDMQNLTPKTSAEANQRGNKTNTILFVHRAVPRRS